MASAGEVTVETGRAKARVGVLGRRTRGEPTSELSERTSQPPPSTTSGHCMRVRPGSPITYVHDKVVALKHPTVPAPPAAWSHPRTVSTETSPALAIRQMSLLQKPLNPIPISSLLNIPPLRGYLRYLPLPSGGCCKAIHGWALAGLEMTFSHFQHSRLPLREA